MSPSGRVVGIAVVLALALMVLPGAVVVLAAVALATIGDAVAARAPVVVERRVPARLARGVPARLTVTVEGAGARRVEVRQPRGPDVDVAPGSGLGGLDAEIVARRRGRHELP